MFSAWWTTPYEGKIETLRFSVDPRRRGLGRYQDVDGVEWDVHAIMGEYINARRVDQHPNYYSTSTFAVSGQDCDIIDTWKPYRVEVIGG